MPPIPVSPFRFALVGAGRVGTAVAHLLVAAGHELSGVTSRTDASAQAAAELLAAPVFPLDGRWPRVDVVLVGAPDGALAGLAPVIASASPAAIACHFAGSLGTSVLDAVVGAGGGACALHPVQACPDVGSAIRRLPGSAWGVTTSPGLVGWAEAVVEDDLRGAPVAIGEQDRPLWHAAAVTTSNGIAALLALGETILSRLAITEPQRVLGPLAAGTVANASEGGGGGATLTGPAVRGETATIERHLDALREAAPELVPAYALAVRVVVTAAQRAERIDPEAHRQMLELLERR